MCRRHDDTEFPQPPTLPTGKKMENNLLISFNAQKIEIPGRIQQKLKLCCYTRHKYMLFLKAVLEFLVRKFLSCFAAPLHVNRLGRNLLMRSSMALGHTKRLSLQ